MISGLVDSIQNPDRALENQILLANADGSNLSLLLGEQNMNYNSAKLSPTGKWLAFIYGSTGFVEVPRLGIMNINNASKRCHYNSL
ncbi:MAG: hypothetical protein WKF59_00595 [Chitinophagaceae bacterium]